MDSSGEETEAGDGSQNKKNLQWLGPAGASLARLDQVKTNVYSVGLMDAKDLKVASGSRFRSHRSQGQGNGGTSQLQRKSAWGSSGSLSGLVEKHNILQKKRPESAKVNIPSRPASGKKPRPHSAHDPTRPAAYPPYMTGLKDRIDLNQIKPFIAVKGAHYEPGERPGNIGPYQQSTVGSMGANHEREINATLQKILDCQDRFHGYSSGEEGHCPPPPPRTSPDLLEMINDARDDSVVDEILYDSRTDMAQTKPPKRRQSRRPLPPKPVPPPQPIHLSLPHASMEEVPEEAEIDTERLIGSASHHLSKGESKTVNLYQKDGFRYVHADVKVNSPSVEDCADESISHNDNQKFRSHHNDTDPCSQNRNNDSDIMELTAGRESDLGRDGRCERDTYLGHERDLGHWRRLEEKKVIDDINGASNRNVFKAQNEHNRHAAVTFSEDQNVTVDITPRNLNQSHVRSYGQSERADLRNVKSRVDSGIKLTYKPVAAHKSVNNRPQSSTHGTRMSAKEREKVSMISLLFSDESDNEDEDGKVKSKKKTKPVNPDVETMMSRISLSDGEDGEPHNSKQHEHSKAEAKAEKPFVSRGGSVNYYELMRQSQGDSEEPLQQKITNNFIVLHDRQVIVQKNVHLMEAPPQKELARPSSSLQRPSSGLHRPSSGLQRPICAQNAEKATNATESTHPDPHERPHSRMSYLDSSPDGADHNKKVRPVSAPTYKTSIKKSHTAAKGFPKRRPVSAHLTPNKPKVFCHNSSHVDTAIQPSAIEAKRANAAVQAMMEGKLFEKKTNSANCFAGRKIEKKDEKPQKVIEIHHRKDDYDIDSEDMRECKELQDRLIENGVPVSLETLARALLPPAPQSSYGYEEDMAKRLPKHHAGLLSKPKTWLPDEFNRLVAARKAVRLATESLLQQDREARRAAGLLSSGRKKKKVPTATLR